MHHYKGSVQGIFKFHNYSTGEELVPVLKAMYKGAQVPKGLKPHEAALLLVFHIHNMVWHTHCRVTLMHHLFMVFCEMWRRRKCPGLWTL